jgi:type I restriction enzyme S subunit
MKAPWDIPGHWVWTTMGEAADVVGGGTPSTKDPTNFSDDGVPWITPADLSGYRQTYIGRGERDLSEKGLAESGARLMPSGTVLFSSRAPIGYVAIAANPVSTNQGFKSFVLPTELDSKYIYYYLKRAKELAVALSSGTTFREISGAKAAQIPLPICPLPEQQRIVEAIETQLTRLDAAVAALKRAQANLKRYRASILKAAVEGRLVPTEAESASRLPNRDGDSLPRIPEHWRWSTWARLAERVTVGHVGPMKHEYVPHGIPFLRSQNVRENRFSSDGLLFIGEEFHRKLSKSRLCPGDLVVVRSGSVGVTCVIPETLPDANCADLVIIRRPRDILPDFGSYYMNSLAKGLIRAGQVGSALTHFNTKSVAALPVPVPPFDEQEQIVAEVDRRLSITTKQENVIELGCARAERLRQSILERAFGGKLVPQDLSDEPASELMERIQAERPSVPASAISRKRASEAQQRLPL